jgi:hypothetical protein
MNKGSILISLTFLSLATNFAAADDAGTVVFATGSVTAERQPPVSLAKGDAVHDNDTVATGDASRIQIQLTDGAKIAIRPNSRFRIDEYVFAGAGSGKSDDAVVSSSGDRNVATLIKGGFRTITGAIGKENREDYEVRTPVGVLGIRGTDYSAVFCNADCNFVPGVNPNAPIEDGLYLGVTEGTIVFRNENGDIQLQAGEYAFIPLADRTPVQMDVPPPVLLDDNDLRFDADGNLVGQEPRQEAAGSSELSGFDNKLGTRRVPESSESQDSSDAAPGDDMSIPAQPINGIDADGSLIDITPGNAPPPNGIRTISYSTGPLGRAATLWSGTLENEPSMYSLDSGNNPTGFNGEYASASGPIVASIDIGTATIVESGFDSITVMRWGRWSGGVAGVDTGAGQTDTIDLDAQSLHWISGPDSGTPAMPITGAASYSLLGSTSPTDNLGNIGVLGGATFDADFTNLTVDSTLLIDINSVNWSAAGTGDIGAGGSLPAHLFSGSYVVTVGGSTSGTGVFSGFFSDPGATSDPAFPGAAGLTYSLQDMAGTSTVSGAAVFGNP